MFTDDEIRQLTQKHLDLLKKAGCNLLECQADHFAWAFDATIKADGDVQAAIALYQIPWIYASRNPYYRWAQLRVPTPDMMVEAITGKWRECYVADAFEAAYPCALGEIMARKQAQEPALT